MRVSRKYVIAATVGALLSVTAVTGAEAVTQAPVHPQYQPEMIKALAASLGVSEQAATAQLERQDAQQARLASLSKRGIKADGAFFDRKGALTVNATDTGTAARIKAEGLNSQVPAHGQAALDRIKARLDTAAVKQAPTGVTAWSVDLASDTVTVEVNNASTPAARGFIKEAKAFGSAVRVVSGKQALSPMGVIYPGSRMTFDKDGGGFLCSVGYGAHDSSGKQYLVTAGHCVENLPVLSYNGTRFAKATGTRFAVGRRSVDMGVAAIDSGNSIATLVGTWGNGSDVAVNGSRRAASGAALCKSGQTTGWTCGKVNSYNASVTYTDQHGGPDTVVTGLGSSSVCTEGGDSGGAYISGNQGQGMTSGGPTGQQCAGGVNSRGSSYFQPLDDALSYYGLTLNTN
ncbi:S1 family peptidase [Streptomyces sp. NBC_00304]|uniref:S1 family peptidase n=1 Tax=Streptomyces sp. NBC_00304 TaxID=2975706 RepID=UPI002E2DFA76|nr:S1 family peptidase [Streptomyces sp. NBC_00304]